MLVNGTDRRKTCRLSGKQVKNVTITVYAKHQIVQRWCLPLQESFSLLSTRSAGGTTMHLLTVWNCNVKITYTAQRCAEWSCRSNGCAHTASVHRRRGVYSTPASTLMMRLLLLLSAAWTSLKSPSQLTIKVNTYNLQVATASCKLQDKSCNKSCKTCTSNNIFAYQFCGRLSFQEAYGEVLTIMNWNWNIRVQTGCVNLQVIESASNGFWQ